MTRLMDAEIAVKEYGWTWKKVNSDRSILIPPQHDERATWTTMWDKDGIPHYLPEFSKEERVKPEQSGIAFEISTTDFELAIKMCELAFAEPSLYKRDWEQIKASNNFTLLSMFLKAHEVNNELFSDTGGEHENSK